MNKEFDECTYLSQVRKLRALAHEVLKSYPIRNYTLDFINHGENTTFKVVTSRKNYLLRIHCRSHRTRKAILEELKWLKKLSVQEEIHAQLPVETKEGKLLINVFSDSMGHSRLCDLLVWQEGYIKNKKNADTFYEVGKLVGRLQTNDIKTNHRKYWHAEGLLGREATLGSIQDLYPSFPRYAKRLEFLRKTLLKKLKTYEKRNQGKLGLIHADLHFGNMIWNKGEVSPIDFDDCGYGIRLYDLAVTLAQSSVYFKKAGKTEARRAKRSLLKGYENSIELSEEDLAILPYLVATRGITMLGWLYGRRDNPEFIPYLKKNLGKRVKSAENYLVQARAGTFFQ